MRDLLDLTLVDVESVTVRAVPGHGDQAEAIIRMRACFADPVFTRHGVLTLRLLPRAGRTLRLTDLRRRDKTRTARLVAVLLTERSAR